MHNELVPYRYNYGIYDHDHNRAAYKLIDITVHLHHKRKLWEVHVCIYIITIGLCLQLVVDNIIYALSSSRPLIIIYLTI